jgi:surface polysaccharide O-acyltransferase-like enzyme
MGQAILVLSDDNILTSLHPSVKKTVRENHWICQVLAAICILVGFVTIIVDKNIKGRSHFHTDHAILGLVTIILSFVACAGGIFVLFAAKLKDWVKPSYLKISHAVIGIITFVLGIASQATGMIRWNTKSDNTGTVCIVLLAFAAFVVFEGAVRHAYSRLIRLSS